MINLLCTFLFSEMQISLHVPETFSMCHYASVLVHELHYSVYRIRNLEERKGERRCVIKNETGNQNVFVQNKATTDRGQHCQCIYSCFHLQKACSFT